MSPAVIDRSATRSHLDAVHHYLVEARGALVWKLDGLDEYDLRRPLTPSGTNLLGLVKHLTGVELLYLGVGFGRFSPTAPRWFGQQMPLRTDLFATADESRQQIVEDYRLACAHADGTLAALPDDATAAVPWLSPEPVGLHRILVHLLAETERHAGHADIVRELVDGALGRSSTAPQIDNTGGGDIPDTADWQRRSELIENTARTVAGTAADVR